MKSLKKTLLARFAFIVILQTLLTLLAVYAITLWNMKASSQWQLENFEAALIERLGQASLDQSSRLGLGVGEEGQFSFALKDKEQIQSAGRYSSELRQGFGEISDGFILKDHKAFSLRRRYKHADYELLTSINVELDLIDDVLWTFALILPIILFPALYLSYRTFEESVRPIKEVSTALSSFEQGDLSSRVELNGKSIEVAALETGLNRTLDQLQEAFFQAERFNAHAAHELKTPLTVIKGELDLCLQQSGDFEGCEAAVINCLENVHQLQGIIETLLLISSPGAEYKNSFIPCDLKSCIEDNEEIFTVLAANKGVELCYELQEVQFVCSEKLMKQAMFNLVENAIKYSPKGSRIRICLLKREDYFEFAVNDLAVQLTQSERSAVFEPFYRLPSSISGSGLGLSLVKWIADIHSLQIAVKSTEAGNCFSFKGQVSSGYE